MTYAKKLVSQVATAALTMIALATVAAVFVSGTSQAPVGETFQFLLPIFISFAVVILLIMTLLYCELSKILEGLAAREEAATQVSLHDPLTGLSNKTLLVDRIEQSLRHMKREGGHGALLMIDLDGFKQINDAFGHTSGDELIKEVAQRLLWRLREVDTVARLGGDEFAVWLSDVPTSDGVETVCRAILSDLIEVCPIADQQIYVSASIGAIHASASDAVGDLLRKADFAMYDAKADGRNCHKIFTDGMDAEVKRRGLIKQKLRHTLESENGAALAVQFQPLIKRDYSILGVELFLRWDDAELGIISPAEVIPIAEDCGLIDKVSQFVIDQACSAAKRFPDLQISVNLSPSQFRDENLAWRISEQVKRNGVKCGQIELEITELLLLAHNQICGQTLRQLREAGFRIALDDFGTGYSSLSHLHEFEVDTVKLDRAFIQSAKRDKSLAILRSTVQLGHAINLRVVAEGIENAEQENIAWNAGCDLCQGNHYAPPMAASALVNFVQNNKRFSSLVA
ncbi:putative bifunctional diguanylate cyclase/phosphodiesterase [Parasphingorhabdus sp.]|uniref:putative bifunctional diguanylate cyclase/phosphodiesterase n=1 Tax=Parasphingorhabdus sp. TaxID=2709688 RepID=UPI003002FFB4